MEGHDNLEEVRNHECQGSTDTNTSLNISTGDLLNTKSQLSCDNLPLRGDMGELPLKPEPPEIVSCEDDKDQHEMSKLISIENKTVLMSDNQMGSSPLKDEGLPSEGEATGTLKTTAEKRRRRRSTIKMTAKQTQEIHHSTSIVSPKNDNANDTSGYFSCDDELLTKRDGSLRKRPISRVNIFVVARAVHRVGSTGEMVKAEDPPCARCVTIPSSAALIQPDLLNSGVAFSSGKSPQYIRQDQFFFSFLSR